MKRLIVLVCSSMLLLAGCQKNGFIDMIPDSLLNLKEIEQSYEKELIANTDGWYFSYQPVNNGVYADFWIKFKENGLCDIISDVEGYGYEHKDVRFKFNGLVLPELSFSSYNALHKVTEHLGGKFEFNISKDGDDFVLIPVNSGTSNRILLKKSNAVEKQNLLNRADMVTAFREFSINADAYFKNLVLDDLSIFFDINTDTRLIKFSWVDSENDTHSQEINFNYINNGIRLVNNLVVNNKVIDEIIFGEANRSYLEVIRAGNAGAGRLEVSHVPATPTPYVADTWLWEDKQIQMWGTTLDAWENHISTDLTPLWSQLRTDINSPILRLQIYNNATPNRGTYTVAFLVRLPNTTTGEITSYHLHFPVTYQKMNDDHLIATFSGEMNGNAAGLLAAGPYKQKFLDMLNILFPPQGVTIVPAGKNNNNFQRFRIVSRQDSRIHVTLAIDVLLDVSWN